MGAWTKDSFKNDTSFLEKRSKKPRSVASRFGEAIHLLPISAALAIALSLAGCGFKPLYGSHSDVTDKLAGIDVGNISNRTGQVLRQELQRRMLGSEAGPVAYELSVNLTLHTDIAGIIATNTVASRERLEAQAKWSLSSVGTPATVVAHGTANASEGANILNQQYFAADVEIDSVHQHLMELLADQMTAQIAAQLRTHHG
jgi:LPS-assembly lipoprotein